MGPWIGDCWTGYFGYRVSMVCNDHRDHALFSIVDSDVLAGIGSGMFVAPNIAR